MVGREPGPPELSISTCHGHPERLRAQACGLQSCG
jgi:hypothetical protein